MEGIGDMNDAKRNALVVKTVSEVKKVNVCSLQQKTNLIFLLF